MTDSDGLFELRDVTVPGATRPRLDAVTLTIPGGAVGLVGPSGSGKSTLLRCLNRLEAPAAGTVRFHGDDLASLETVSLRRRVGMVFQRPTPFTGSVLDNLRVADPGLGRPEAEHLLSRVRLDPDLLDRDARELSGGEAQRMCLGRTLATAPEVLLLDEPTTALDAAPRIALERLVADLIADGLDAVWVTHDLDQLARVADHAVVLVAGAVAHTGPVASLRLEASAPAIEFLEGGDDH